MSTRNISPVFKQPPYQGATTCFLVPDWRDTDPNLLDLLRNAYAADPDDAAPLLVLADYLAEHNDPREHWVRAGCELWQACRTIQPVPTSWDFTSSKADLICIRSSLPRRRMGCLWSCLVAWHAPSAKGRALGPEWTNTQIHLVNQWANAQIHTVHRLIWWWSLGFLSKGPWAQPYVALEEIRRAQTQTRETRRETRADSNKYQYVQSQLTIRKATATSWQVRAAGYGAFSQEDQGQPDFSLRNAIDWYSVIVASFSSVTDWGTQLRLANTVWSFAEQAWRLCQLKLTAGLLADSNSPGD